MNTRNIKKLNLQKEVQDYEHNQRLFLESRKSELDVILRVSMPHQLANMKTILWLNFLLIGFSLNLLKTSYVSVWVILFSLSSFISIATIVVAMLQRRAKYYGTIEDDKYMENHIPKNEWAKSYALIAISKHIKLAIVENKKIMSYLSKYMHASLWMTLLSVLFFFGIFYYQIQMKGGNVMAEKPKDSTVVVKPLTSSNESAERSCAKPSKPAPQPKPKSD